MIVFHHHQIFPPLDCINYILSVYFLWFSKGHWFFDVHLMYQCCQNSLMLVVLLLVHICHVGALEMALVRLGIGYRIGWILRWSRRIRAIQSNCSNSGLFRSAICEGHHSKSAFSAGTSWHYLRPDNQTSPHLLPTYQLLISVQA